MAEAAGGGVCPGRRVRRWCVSRSVRHFATFGVLITLLVGLQLRFFKKSNPREYTGGNHDKTRAEDGEFVQVLRDADLKCKVRYPLHVSVMTSRSRRPTFASAAHSTWARENEQAFVEFFLPKSAELTTDKQSRPGLPAVVLSDESTLVDVPILRYLCKWREDDFDWFLVTDDQAYVRLDSVIDFLRQMDKTEAIVVSRQGEAFVTDLTWERCAVGDAEDVPLTSLMASSVTVYSGPAVRGICSAVEGCLYDLNNGPLYLTECLSRYTVTICQDQKDQYSHLFFEDTPPTSGPTNVTSGPTLPSRYVNILKNRDVTKALTLSPMRTPEDIYRLHQHFQRVDF
ncbi:CHSY1 [Branchiostoma lanceolatum]|uniref:CHSY1 protein n=1 Tax=Branchiostoma lanceolatum TaxID=7740 RepID=A0A8K0A5L1_BRALA|nr:CHSY1 [Branchiostoma lanceolatum]